jgi:hypothetical protein
MAQFTAIRPNQLRFTAPDGVVDLRRFRRGETIEADALPSKHWQAGGPEGLAYDPVYDGPRPCVTANPGLVRPSECDFVRAMRGSAR